DGDGLAAQRVAALGTVGPVERHGEAGPESHAQRAVLLAGCRERLLQERDPVVVGADPLAPDATEPERSAAEGLGRAEAAADRGRVRERLTRPVRPAGAPLGPAEREQQRTAPPEG